MIARKLKPDRSAIPAIQESIAIALPWRRRAIFERTAWATSGQLWGRLPELMLISALGLLLMALAYSSSRVGYGGDVLFWAGLVVILLPVTVRLLAAGPSRAERLGLLLWAGLALYLAKIMHSPFAFTFADELIHAGHANAILDAGRLFPDVPMLPVIGYYPGLETATTAVANVTGISVFHAGLFVLALTRMILVMSLFLVYEQISQSVRLAGIATLLYMANANFMFWSAQFSYESLSLPLAALAVLSVLKRDAASAPRTRWSWTIASLMLVTTVVVTHHMTSYALIVFLWAITIVSWLQRKPTQAWHIALYATAAVVIWLMTIASSTVGYLTPVISGALNSTFRLIAGEETGRELFRSASGYLAPLWERVVGIGSVLVVVLALPLGAWYIWRQRHEHPIYLVLLGAALAYCGSLLLRLTPAAWEMGNRASEFLYVGVAFVAATTIVILWNLRRLHWLYQAIFAVSALLLFMGGIIAGWPPAVRLPPPYFVSVNGVVIEPPGVAAAQWAYAHLGPGNRIAADESNARLMFTYGGQYPLTGQKGGIKALIFAKQLDWSTAEIVQATEIRYVVLDMRLTSWNTMLGLYFTRPGTILTADDLMEPATQIKFDQDQKVSRLFDSGTLAIYDVGELGHVASVQ
jgi:hypothetical protein